MSANVTPTAAGLAAMVPRVRQDPPEEGRHCQEEEEEEERTSPEKTRGRKRKLPIVQQQEDGEAPSPPAAATAPQRKRKNVKRGTWDQYYNELLLFKATEGHCNVAVTHENKGLSQWVERQRYMRSQLFEEQKKKLDAIGFTWTGVRRERADKQWNEVSIPECYGDSVFDSFLQLADTKMILFSKQLINISSCCK
jgi:hypothetical protein